ncbi:MAG: siderophore-interacting protein [Rhodocyclales bacterium]|nr:siderophore-interacting protein [Rhodocyclales bacterium]
MAATLTVIVRTEAARILAALMLMALAGAAVAQGSSPDATMWLHRMSQASRTLNYSGLFVYQSGGRTESSRITHVVDGSGQQERLETVDGASREVIRNNDEVQTFFPKERLLVIDRAVAGSFPGRAVSVVSGLGDFYVVRLGDVERIAGRDAQAIRLEPRDDMRYGHELWADVATGLLIKARMLRAPGDVVEEFAFSDLLVGPQVDRERVKPRYSRTSDWTILNARGTDLRPDEFGWVFRGLPPGFKQVSLARRPIRKDGPEALHAVFSDGLATISVFIEPNSGRNMSVAPVQSHSGPIGIYKSSKGEVMVTAIGEVPPTALRRVAESVEKQTLKP